MVLETSLPYRDPNAVGYWTEEPLQMMFLIDDEFCSILKNNLESILSIEVEIMQQKYKLEENQRYVKVGFMIAVKSKSPNVTDMGHTVSDFCRNYFNKITKINISNMQVLLWLSNLAKRMRYFHCIQYILKKRACQLYTKCELKDCSLNIYYLTREPFAISDNEDIYKTFQKEILRKVLWLSLAPEQLQQYRSEIRRILATLPKGGDMVVTYRHIMVSPMKIKYKVTLFGYIQSVIQIEEQILKFVEEQPFVELQLNSINMPLIETLLKYCPFGICDIRKEYKDITSVLCSRIAAYNSSEEFERTDRLYTEQLVSKLKTDTFQSLLLPKYIAEKAENQLHSIAHQNHCCIKTELVYAYQHVSIPKTSSTVLYASNSAREQSIQFYLSSDVITKIVVARSSIEIRIGDISQQQVDAIIISTSPDGLQEVLIEYAGTFNYEQTYTDITGGKFTKTNGGNLHCKRILFCDWISRTDIDSEAELRKAIQIFIAKSMEYAMKDEQLKSIAFAVPNLYTDEKILAEELIGEVKRQLELSNTKLTISFILLSEQHSLLNELVCVTTSMQNIDTQYNWTTAFIRIMLIAPESNNISKCKKIMGNYLNHHISSLKITASDGIFNSWEQHDINAFYKFCKDKCVLPQIDNNNNELELSGPSNCIWDAKRKWYLSRELIREKIFNISRAERRGSAQFCMKSTAMPKKIYNVMISYSEKDVKQCQRLIDRLVNEGFHVWTEPIKDEQLRDVSSQMHKADFIILCTSENSYESRSCENEARQVFEIGKPVVLVKLQNDPLIGWQREVFEGKLFIQLFGSNDYFDTNFSYLLLQFYCLTKSSHEVQDKHEDNVILQKLLTIEQRRAKYDEKIKTLMKIGHIDKKHMKDLIDQSNKVLRDDEGDEDDQQEESEITTYRQLKFRADKEPSFEYIRRWLKKPTNNTKQNLPPFSITGDINDAPFPMPEYIIKCLNITNELVSPTQSTPPKLRCSFESGIFHQTTDSPFRRILYNPIPISKDAIYGDSTKNTRLSDTLESLIGNYPNADYVQLEKAKRLPLIPVEILLTNEQALRKCPNFRIKEKKVVQHNKTSIKQDRKLLADRMKNIMERPLSDSSHEYRRKFAEQMSKNIIEFEAFCLEDESKRSMKKRRSQK